MERLLEAQMIQSTQSPVHGTSWCDVSRVRYSDPTYATIPGDADDDDDVVVRPTHVVAASGS